MVKTPEVKKNIESTLSGAIQRSSPTAFAQQIREETEVWKELFRRSISSRSDEQSCDGLGSQEASRRWRLFGMSRLLAPREEGDTRPLLRAL